MKLRLIIYMALAVIGVLWIGVIGSDHFARWLDLRHSEYEGWHVPVKSRPDLAKYKIEKTLKVPWRDARIILLRRNGQAVELNAKTAVYSVFIDKVPPGQRPNKSFDYYAVVFIDPSTQDIWAGWEQSGIVDTNEGFPLSLTNFFFETDSGILRGDSAMWQGCFDCDQSLMGKAVPGEDLNEVISQFDRLEDILSHVEWNIPLRDFFRDGFFNRDGYADVDTQIQSERAVHGKLELDFSSYEYETKGSVWLDLRTFEVRRAVEYRPVRFDADALFLGLGPALAAILTLFWTTFIVLKARSPLQYVLGGIVLVIETRALFMLYNMYIVGAWSDYISVFHYAFALGEWAVYLPIIYIGVGFLTVIIQASLLRNRKQQ